MFSRRKLLVALAAAVVSFTWLPSTLAIQRQHATNWCWAACIQDVLAQAGIHQSQAQIAARLDGWPQNRPAYIPEVVRLAQSYRLRAWQVGRPGTPQELYGTLRGGWKLIAFVRPSNGPVGHFIVLQGVGPNGGIIVSDPWTGQTYEQPAQALYMAWRWGDSVVIGR